MSLESFQKVSSKDRYDATPRFRKILKNFFGGDQTRNRSDEVVTQLPKDGSILQISDPNPYPHLSAKEIVRSTRSEEQMNEEWDKFFQSIREVARQTAEDNPNILRNVDKAIDDFLKAFKSIYIEISIEDQINAIIRGVDEAVDIATKNGLRNIFLLKGNRESDALFVN